MEISEFYALRTGPAPLPADWDAVLAVQDLGVLRVPSGQLGACDPFWALERPVVIPIPAGNYPVRVTVADVSEEHDGSHLREAYVSIVISDAETASLGAAAGTDGPPPPEQFLGVGVDAGTVAFVDAAAVLPSMPADPATWNADVFGAGWFAQLDADTPYPAGLANIVLPLARNGENIVLAHSGWGDGSYPLYATRDADGQLTGIHLDLLVVGTDDDDEDDEEDDD
jgi:hypothetical protein